MYQLGIVNESEQSDIQGRADLALVFMQFLELPLEGSAAALGLIQPLGTALELGGEMAVLLKHLRELRGGRDSNGLSRLYTHTHTKPKDRRTKKKQRRNYERKWKRGMQEK